MGTLNAKNVIHFKAPSHPEISPGILCVPESFMRDFGREEGSHAK
jgi:hypothetical protein